MKAVRLLGSQKFLSFIFSETLCCHKVCKKLCITNCTQKLCDTKSSDSHVSFPIYIFLFHVWIQLLLPNIHFSAIQLCNATQSCCKWISKKEETFNDFVQWRTWWHLQLLTKGSSKTSLNASSIAYLNFLVPFFKLPNPKLSKCWNWAH